VTKTVSRKFGVLLYLEGVLLMLSPGSGSLGVLSPGPRPAGDGVPQLVEEVVRRKD
jgi:hypothetical protein